jgi:exoribonuclease R
VGIGPPRPPPAAETIATLRRSALALGVDWPAGEAPGRVLAGLNPAEPRHAALIEQSARLLRGAAYVAFDGRSPGTAEARHAGIGAPYAHVTAPLRRLVDRFGTEVCLAIAAGSAPPDWARQSLPALVAEMAASDRLAHEADRAVIDATEVFLLAGRVGEQFDAVVLSASRSSATIVLDEPAVRAKCAGLELPVGGRITVRLVAVDRSTRQVSFVLSSPLPEREQAEDTIRPNTADSQH